MRLLSKGGDALSGNLVGVHHYQAILLGTIDFSGTPAQGHGDLLYVGNLNALSAGFSLPTTNDNVTGFLADRIEG